MICTGVKLLEVFRIPKSLLLKFQKKSDVLRFERISWPPAAPLRAYKNKSTDDLLRIASCEGWFILDATSRSTDDLVRIASCEGGAIIFEC